MPEPWIEDARRVVLGYAAAETEAERVRYVERLADAGTDLATWAEVLRLAQIGAVATGVRLKEVRDA